MKYKQLKPGDQVFVVWQKQRFQRQQVMGTVPVAKVGKKFGYITKFADSAPFCLETGRSHHKCTNARANGYAFDVYSNKEEYLALVNKEAEADRLRTRLLQPYSYRFVPMSHECVMQLHAVLDQHEPKQNTNQQTDR